MEQINPLCQEYLTITDVRNYLNISLSKAYELAHSSDFPMCRFGGSMRVPREPFLHWVAHMTRLPDWMGEKRGA